MKKVLTAIGVAAGVLLVLPSTQALAHPSQAWGSCQGGVSFEAHDYPTNGASTVNVVIDNQPQRGYPKVFVGSIQGNIPNGDKTVPHTWVVTFDRFDGTEGDRVHTGSFGACEQATTTTDRPNDGPTTTEVPNSGQPTPTTEHREPTTTIEQRPTTPTAAPTTTTEVIEIGTPPVPPAGVSAAEPPAPPSPPQAAPQLPSTGSNTAAVLFGAFGAIVVGVVLLHHRKVWRR